jgi:enoyl-CoA hydratase/carnithine racemase
MRTPIIAAINGSAVGVGLTLPMTWDVRFVAKEAKLGFVFTRRGVIPEWNSLWLVRRLVGLSRSFDLLLSGRLFTGEEAFTSGLVTESLDAEEVLPAAQSLARDIAFATSPISVGVTKRAVYRFLQEPDREAAYELELRLFRWMSQQDDAVEGVQAFLEQRAPAWSSSKSGDHPPGI